MSHASRHFQMLGSLVAQRDVHAARLPVHKRISALLGPKDSHRLMTAYTGALNGRYRTAWARAEAEHKLNQARAEVVRDTRPKLESIKITQLYSVGDVYRPKRANQHSRNLIVTACTSSHVSYSRGGAETTVTHDAFAALIGRKVS